MGPTTIARSTAHRRRATPAQRSWSRRVRAGVLAAALLFGATTIAAPIAAAQAIPPLPATEPVAPPGAMGPRTATVDQITDNPGAYYGMPVTIVGDVEDVLGARAFTLEDQDLLFDEELLVVSSKPFADQQDGSVDADLLRSQTLMLRGTIHQFNEAAFESRLGIDLNDDRVAEWAGRPALIADRVRVWSPSIAVPWRGNDANDPTVRGQTAIDSITESPMSYVGQAVTTGGYVDTMLSERAFVLEDGDLLSPEQVLVVTRQPAGSLPGMSGNRGLSTHGYVWVSGTVHQFNQAAFEEQLGISLDDARFADWAGRPAIIAGSLVPVRSRVEAHPPVAVGPATGAPTSIPQGQPSATPQSGASTGANQPLEGNSAIDAILNAPDSYVGQTTTVAGRILQMVGPRSFVVTDSDAEAEQLLVIGALTLPTALVNEDPTPDAGERVQATGEIWRFDLPAIEDRLGIDLDDSLFADWIDKPVMIATNVTPSSAN